jgi:aspartyl-tRNA synthetase
MLKTQNCGELRLSDVSKTVILAGWLQRTRSWQADLHDLRDRSGLVQVTADPTVGEAYSV